MKRPIFVQTILAYSPIQAGLTYLPFGIAVAVTAPQAGRLTDRLGGRTVLAAGGFIYTVGVALLAFLISTDAGWQTFVIPFVLCGVGTGGMVAPSMTVAMNDVALAQAGAASGVLNTTRQVATALGAAVVGAVLQNQLLTNMQAGAGSAAAQLPEAVREPFVRGFQAAARGGFQVGRGQSGGAQLPGGITHDQALQVQQLIHEVFGNAYVNAARSSLLIPAAGLLLAAALSLVIRSRASAPAPDRPIQMSPEPASAAGPGA